MRMRRINCTKSHMKFIQGCKSVTNFPWIIHVITTYCLHDFVCCLLPAALAVSGKPICVMSNCSNPDQARPLSDPIRSGSKLQAEMQADNDSDAIMFVAPDCFRIASYCGVRIASYCGVRI